LGVVALSVVVMIQTQGWGVVEPRGLLALVVEEVNIFPFFNKCNNCLMIRDISGIGFNLEQ
jgi:hypothetical protein